MSTKYSAIVCNECDYEFSMNSVKIKEATVNVGKKEEIILMYFTCPKCNKIYRIMIKDKQYEVLKEDLEKIKTRIRKNNGSRNDELARVLDSMVIKKHERLKNHMMKLNERFSGTFTFVVSENNHKEKIIKYLP